MSDASQLTDRPEAADKVVDSIVKISYTLTAEEFSEGFRTLLLRSTGMRISIVLVAGLALFQSVTLVSGTLSLGPVVLTLLIVAFLVYQLVGQPRVRFRRQVRASRYQSHVFSEEGVVSTMAEAEARQGWAYFRETKETSRLYLMFTDQGSVNMIPKRVLGEREDAIFRGLLQRHTKAKFRSAASASEAN